MRLIDADALVKTFESMGLGEHGLIERVFADGVYAVIENAPTIDAAPVRCGTWEWYEEPYDSRNPDGNYGWRCSCCKQDLAAELTLGISGMHYAYAVLDDPDNPPTIKRCLFCGAKMDGRRGR